MLGPAYRAMDACEEDRRSIEALAIGDETGGDVASGNFTSWPFATIHQSIDKRATFPILISLSFARVRIKPPARAWDRRWVADRDQEAAPRGAQAAPCEKTVSR
jgi:hypothetical protein